MHKCENAFSVLRVSGNKFKPNIFNNNSKLFTVGMVLCWTKYVHS